MYLTSPKPEAGEQADSDLRELTFKKNNYGPVSSSLVLRYKDGLFLPERGMSTLERLAREQKADETFAAQIIKFTAQARNTSAKPNAPTYAPTEFAKEPEAKKAGLRKADFEAAMRRLLEAGKIRIVPYGPPSRGWSKLEIV
jgi:RecA-family ATPase